MDHINHFRDMFESITDHRKIALLIILIKDDKNLFEKSWF